MGLSGCFRSYWHQSWLNLCAICCETSCRWRGCSTKLSMVRSHRASSTRSYSWLPTCRLAFSDFCFEVSVSFARCSSLESQPRLLEARFLTSSGFRCWWHFCFRLEHSSPQLARYLVFLHCLSCFLQMEAGSWRAALCLPSC